jgi:hypothetical protein
VVNPSAHLRRGWEKTTGIYRGAYCIDAFAACCKASPCLFSIALFAGTVRLTTSRVTDVLSFNVNCLIISHITVGLYDKI